MRTINSHVLLLIIFLLAPIAKSQITLTATGGTLTGSYTTIKAAFDAINAGTHKTSITIKITANTAETASAVLNATGTGSASYGLVSIYPTVTASITGSIAGPLISLNGADNITIDGRINATGATQSLTISNTSTSSAVGVSTIKFAEDAQSNTVKYCILKGSSLSTTGGIVYFGTTTKTYGNDNNYLSYNVITSSSDASRPLYAINALGTTSKTNDGTIINNNSFYNFLSRGSASYGIYVGDNSSAWTIDANSFYETASFVPTASVAYSVIQVNSTIGSGFIITNNYIGGSSASCAGTAWTKTNAFDNAFSAISLSAGTSTASSIQGNTIKNFAWSNSANANFTAFDISFGSVDIGTSTANNIGAATGGGSITLTNGTTGGYFYGMDFTGNDGTCTINVKNNNIGAITTAGATTTIAVNFIGIYNPGTSSFTCSSNTIGSASTAGSINVSSLSSSNAQIVTGIMCSGASLHVISSNTIARMTNATTNITAATAGYIYGIHITNGNDSVLANSVNNLTIANANSGTSTTPSAAGIVIACSSSVYQQTVHSNTVYNISNSYTAFTGAVLGIAFTPNATSINTLGDNFVYGLTVNSGSTAAYIYGLAIWSGDATIVNNIISLACTTQTTLYGIYDSGVSGDARNIFYNTVYLSGTSASGTNKSAALYCAASLDVLSIQNNILFNARSTTGGLNLHYAAYFNFSVTTNLSFLNSNCYYTTGTGSVLGYYASTNKTSLPLVTGFDSGSLNVDPRLSSAGGTSAANYTASAYLLANPNMYVSDYNQTTRSVTYPSMGAIEYTISRTIVASGTSDLIGYNTLSAAFTDINNGTLTGVVTIKVQSSTTETVTSTLNASGSGSASYTSVTIYPTASGKQIVCNFQGGLIKLDGATNVTFDGRLNATGSTRDMSIISPDTLNPVITFVNGASNNTIQYCKIKGAGYSNTGTLPIIYLSTSTAAAGNNNNTINNNEITCYSDTYRANYCITSWGTTGKANTGNTITGNSFHDFFHRTYGGIAIYAPNYTTGMTITGNSFYESTSFAPTSTASISFIYLNTGSGHTISRNYIGGKTDSTGSLGVPMTKTNGASNQFTGIYVSGDSTVTNEIQGNIIKNINWSNAGAANFYAFSFTGGAYNIGNTTANVIGAATGTGSITVTNGATGSAFYGINIGSAAGGAINMWNNIISSIYTTTSDAAHAFNIYLFQISGNRALTCQNNTFGTTDASTSYGIQAASTSTSNSQTITAINSGASGSVIITGNTISKLFNAVTSTSAYGSTTGIMVSTCYGTITNNTVRDIYIMNAYSGETVMGIYISTANPQTITGNTVYNLYNNSTTLGTQIVEGIAFYGTSATTTTISNNFMYNIGVYSGNRTAKVYGIYHSGGSVNIANNIISIGTSGEAYANIWGILDAGNAGQTSNILYNTVYIYGSTLYDLASKSYAYYSYNSNNIRVIQNNIFSNTRSTTGGSNVNYGAYLPYSSSTNLTISNNDYYTPGTGGTIGYYNSTNITVLPIVLGVEEYSRNTNPNFASAGGTSAINYKASATSLVAKTGTGITLDYTGATRSVTLPAMGAYEYTVVAQPPPVLVTANSTSTNYSSVRAAFNAINAGTHTGSIVLILNESITESAACVLNASGTGSASYTGISIYPAAAGLTIAGNFAAPLIDLSGADNVKIDGRVNATGGTRSLTLINSNATTTAGNSTIRFINDATGDTIRYCNIKGSTTATGSGVIFFSSTTGTTGNDNNTIYNCAVTCASDANRPIYGVFSWGTAAMENSGNTLSSNIFYNLFSTSILSNYIKIYSASTAWTISGNSCYETSSIVPAMSSAYTFLSIGGGDTYVISGNYFGGTAASCGGTALTKTAGNTNDFYGISISTSGTGVNSIQGNVISNIAWSNLASGSFYGLQLYSGSFDVGTTSGNTIGAASGNGSITLNNNGTSKDFYGIYTNGGSPALMNISNNTVGSITLTNADTRYPVNFYGVRQSGSAQSKFSNNLFGSTNAGTTNSINASSPSYLAAQTVIGIYLVGNAVDTLIGNTISKMTNANEYSLATSEGINIGILGITGTFTILNNTIRDLTIKNADTSGYTGRLPSVIGISILNSAAVKHTISGNTIYNLSNTFLGYSGEIDGIRFDYSGVSKDCIINGNLVYGLSVTNSDYGTIYGIRAVKGTATCTNNMIALGNSYPATVYGIYESGKLNSNFYAYFNSIYIGGNPAVEYNSSYAYSAADTLNIKDLRDNIFSNLRHTVSGTNNNLCINLPILGYRPSGITFDNNLFYATDTASVFGVIDVGGVSLRAWQNLIGNNLASSYANPNFIGASANPPNLHLQSPTPAEDGGIIIASVTTDFDGSLRSGLSPVDIGADAGNFTSSGDIYPPSISFTILGNDAPSNRVLINFADIQDNTGISSGVNAPRLYFKRGIDNDAFIGNTSSENGWKYVTGTSLNPYSFTIDYSLLYGGATIKTGELIQYFVVAQDDAGNFTSLPAGATAGSTPPVSHITKKPDSPYGYYITGALSGSYNIGTGQIYKSLTGAADGIFAAVNAATITDNLIINVVSDITESGEIALNQLSESGSGGYSLTVQPSNATLKNISGNYYGSLIHLNGSDRVTVNGNYNGSGQYLFFSNSWVNDFYNPDTTLSVFGLNNSANNNNIKNCKIYSKYCGIYLSNTDNTLIEGNEIFSDSAGLGSGDLQGIYISTNANDNRIRRNSIHDFYYNDIWGLRSVGIYYNNNRDTLSEISNNMIYKIKGCGSTADNTYNPAGIYLKTAAPVNIYSNSIYMSGNVLGADNTNGYSSCITIASGYTPTGLDIRNNNLYNSMGRVTGSTASPLTYLIYSQVANTAFSYIDYNNYYFTDQANITENIGFIGTSSATLSAWKTATGKDANSRSVDALFHSPSNLHLVPSSPLVNTGVVISGQTTDYDADTRSLSTPCIGADEFTAATASVTGNITNPAALTYSQLISTTGAGGVTINPSAQLSGKMSGYYYSSGRTGQQPEYVTAIANYYWALSTNISSFNESLRIYFDKIPANTITDTATMVLLHRPYQGASWQIYSNVVKTTSYIQANNLSSFSEFTLASVENAPLPVEMSTFTAKAQGRNILLKWRTETELRNYGFNVERKNKAGVWGKIGFVAGHGNSNVPKDYSFTDKNEQSGTVCYRLKQLDVDGSYSYSKVVETLVAIPEHYELSQNYPNPFNPSTTIEFMLPVEGMVNITVYNTIGQKITELMSEPKAAGYYSVVLNNGELASGMYIYRMHVRDINGKEFTKVKKMLLIK